MVILSKTSGYVSGNHMVKMSQQYMLTDFLDVITWMWLIFYKHRLNNAHIYG